MSTIIVTAQPRLKPYQRLQRHWAATGGHVKTTNHTESEVAALESKYGIRIPDDFREYLLASCSADEDLWDGFVGWWPLERIKNIPDELPNEAENPQVAANAKTYLFFADYSIWCWAWAIACGDDENRGRVAVISGHDRFVADSFSDFVDLYIINQDRLV
jgi:SMI1 / KNR4 family (SUKH-1)